MKKIVGILAAAAMIATTVFAADVSAQVRIAGDIFSYDGTAIDKKEGKAAGSFSALRAATQSQPYWTPYITLSTSTDEAGAEVKFITGGDGTTDVSIDRSNVWFKPLDMLTIKAGFQGYSMNTETIDWTSTNGAENWGYALNFAQDAITANVYAITGNNGWFFKDVVANKGDSTSPNGAYINDLYANFAYSADFGTISAMFEYKGKNWAADSCNPDTIKFGAGYKNTIDALTFFADVVGTSYSAWSDDEVAAIQAGAKIEPKGDDDIEKAFDQAAKEAKFVNYTDKDGKQRSAFGLAVDAFVQYAQDALTVKGYVKLNIADFGNLNNKGDADLMYANNTALTLKARVDYKLDNGINLFAYFGCNNLLQKETKNGDTDPYASSVFAATIKAGANGSVGICAWETCLQLTTGNNVAYKKGVDKDTWGKYDKVNVSMPVTLTVAF